MFFVVYKGTAQVPEHIIQGVDCCPDGYSLESTAIMHADRMNSGPYGARFEVITSEVRRARLRTQRRTTSPDLFKRA